MINTLCLLSGISSTVIQFLEMAESSKAPLPVSAVTVTGKGFPGVDNSDDTTISQAAQGKFYFNGHRFIFGYFLNLLTLFSGSMFFLNLLTLFSGSGPSSLLVECTHGFSGTLQCARVPRLVQPSVNPLPFLSMRNNCGVYLSCNRV